MVSSVINWPSTSNFSIRNISQLFSLILTEMYSTNDQGRRNYDEKLSGQTAVNPLSCFKFKFLSTRLRKSKLSEIFTAVFSPQSANLVDWQF